MVVRKHAHVSARARMRALSPRASYFSRIIRDSVFQRALFLSFTWTSVVFKVKMIPRGLVLTTTWVVQSEED